MADVITFTPYLEWVDVPNPNEPPDNARFITAADLKRYETFGRDAAKLLNMHAVKLAAHDTSLGTLSTSIDQIGRNNTAISDRLNNATSGLDAKAPKASPTFTGTVSGITKAMVGLGNVDNTADTAKPVSTAQKTYIDAVGTRVTKLESGSAGLGTARFAGGGAVASGATALFLDKASYAFKAGRSYLITAIGGIHGTAGSMAGQVEFYVANPGTTGIVTGAVNMNVGATIWTSVPNMSGSYSQVSGLYTPTADSTRRVYATLSTVVGAGTIYVNAFTLLIEDKGVAV